MTEHDQRAECTTRMVIFDAELRECAPIATVPWQWFKSKDGNLDAAGTNLRRGKHYYLASLEPVHPEQRFDINRISEWHGLTLATLADDSDRRGSIPFEMFVIWMMSLPCRADGFIPSTILKWLPDICGLEIVGYLLQMEKTGLIEFDEEAADTFHLLRRWPAKRTGKLHALRSIKRKCRCLNYLWLTAATVSAEHLIFDHEDSRSGRFYLIWLEMLGIAQFSDTYVGMNGERVWKIDAQKLRDMITDYTNKEITEDAFGSLVTWTKRAFNDLRPVPYLDVVKTWPCPQTAENERSRSMIYKSLHDIFGSPDGPRLDL
ncbi:MAG: hypothetical protein GY826_19580, partial [Fuerstiella sp.]|nr:hypothetical protein [Fuerstiella sp.]